MLKIINIVLGTIAVVVGITFFTATPPMPVQTVADSKVKLSTEYFPKILEIVGRDKLVPKEELFLNGSKTLLIVGNHDSMSVIKDLKKYLDIKIPYVMVANISNAPWFIKKWAIPGKLEELTQGIKVPMIYDYDGFMVNALALNNTEATKYFAYLVNEDGSVKNIYVGSVKEGSLENGFTPEEAKEALSPLMEFLK